ITFADRETGIYRVNLDYFKQTKDGGVKEECKRKAFRKIAEFLKLKGYLHKKEEVLRKLEEYWREIESREWWEDSSALEERYKLEKYLEEIDIKEEMKGRIMEIVLYYHDLVLPLSFIKDKKVDFVVAIPFKGDKVEAKSIKGVIKAAAFGVRKYFPDKKVLILAVAGPYDSNVNEAKTSKAAQETFEEISSKNIEGFCFALVNKGKGWGMRAAIDLIAQLEVPFIFLDADLRQLRIEKNKKSRLYPTQPWKEEGIVIGLQPKSIKWLLTPILEGKDYVMSHYLRDPLDGTITNNIILPGIKAIFGLMMRQGIGGEFAGSPKLAKVMRDYLDNVEAMISDAMTYGIDICITIQAIINQLNIGEAFNTVKVHNPSEGKLGETYQKGGMFSEVTKAFFDRVIEYQDYWLNQKEEEIGKVEAEISEEKIIIPTLTNPQDVYPVVPEPVPFDWCRRIKEFEEIFKKDKPYNYEEEYKRIFMRHIQDLSLTDEEEESIYYRIKELVEKMQEEVCLYKVEFSPHLWAKIYYSVLLAYAQAESKEKREKIIELFKPLYYAKAASYACWYLRNFSFSDLESIKKFRENLSKEIEEILEKINNNQASKFLEVDISFEKLRGALVKGERYFYQQTEEFIRLRPYFIERWRQEIKKEKEVDLEKRIIKKLPIEFSFSSLNAFVETFPEKIREKYRYPEVMSLLYILAFFRGLSQEEQEFLLNKFSQEERLWIRDNLDKDWHEIIRNTSSSFQKEKVEEYIKVRNEIFENIRALKIASQILNKNGGLSEIIEKKEILEVIAGIKDAVLFEKDTIKALRDLEELLWGLRQINGVNVKVLRLPDGRIYIYDEYSLRKKALNKEEKLASTEEGLKHSIKLDFIREEGLFYGLIFEEKDEYEDLINLGIEILRILRDKKLLVWDKDKKIWRAKKILQRIIKITPSSLKEIYLATMNRPSALRRELEIELENHKIFNHQIPLVVIDDSKEEILRLNQETIKELKEKYQAPIIHLTGKDREKYQADIGEKLILEFSQKLNEGRLEKDTERILRDNKILADKEIILERMQEYINRNVFFHISGVRNFTVLIGKGSKVIMNIDDDAPAETYVLPYEEREKIRTERLKKREEVWQRLVKEVEERLGVKIENEEEFYRIWSQNIDEVKDLEEKYWGFSQDGKKGLISQAMEEIGCVDDLYIDKELKVTHQRYQSLMEPLPTYAIRLSDFIYKRPRVTKEDGEAFEVFPVDTIRIGEMIDKKVKEVDLPFVEKDLRGTQGLIVTEKERLKKKEE
ncbi:MAG: hypothetical protein DRP81_07050, partial [Candidatus Omnitrophota bacterium]